MIHIRAMHSQFAFLPAVGLGLMAILASPAPAQTNAGKVYVANQASDDVTVFNAQTYRVLATIPVEDRPHNVNHTPDGQFVLVTDKNVNLDRPPAVSLIDPNTDEVVGTIRGIGKRIEHVVSAAPDQAYVVEDFGWNAVVTLDLVSREIVDRVGVGIKPHGLWPTPDGRYLFVPNQLTGTVSKIDTESMTVVGEAHVGRTPTMVAVSPDGARAYATLYGERGLAVLDAQKVESKRLQVNDVIPIGERPAQVAVTPDEQYVLVPCEGPGALYVVSVAGDDVVGIVPTGGKAHGVDVSDDSRFAYVSNWADDTVSVVDLTRMVVIRQIPVGDEPAGIDFVASLP